MREYQSRQGMSNLCYGFPRCDGREVTNGFWMIVVLFKYNKHGSELPWCAEQERKEMRNWIRCSCWYKRVPLWLI